MKTLNFENGIAEMDLPTLHKTVDYEMAKGSLPKTRPLHHSNLITQLHDEINRVDGVSIVQDPIYATEKQAMRVMWPHKDKECPVENLLIQRLITNIGLKVKGEKEMSMNIALSYHERGIALAFGPKVWACSNLCVFGDNVMRTYGSDKVPFDTMIDNFKGWMARFGEMRDQDFGMVEKMKAREIEENAKDLVFGKLIHNAVLMNMDSKHEAPLNQTQVADFVRASYSDEYQVPANRKTNVWDLLQMSTNALKPQNTDMTQLIDYDQRITNFLVEEFELN